MLRSNPVLPPVPNISQSLKMMFLSEFALVMDSITLPYLDSGMFNVMNSSIMNNFTIVQELSRTPENTEGQQNVFQEAKDSEF